MSWSDLLAFYHGHAGQSLVLVTLVEKQGSSYRQPGARMLVDTDGKFSGSVSAGCLEEEIARTARDSLRANAPRLLTIDTRPHYGCPGRITVLLEILSPSEADDLFTAIDKQLRDRAPFTLSTDYRIAEVSQVRTTFLKNHPQTHTPSHTLLQSVGRQPRLIVIGSGDDAHTLAKMALLAEWDAHVLPVTENQFSPQSISRQYRPDDRTAVVLMTHNLGHDAACLHVVLRDNFSYVGVIGSAKRRRELISVLQESEDSSLSGALEHFFCPAGLDLGSNDVGEIAISILSEIQRVWSGRDASSLRHRTGPIHENK